MYEGAPHPLEAAIASGPVLSNSGRRLHPRVSTPLVAEIAGKAYHARDWSAGGLTLRADGPLLEAGQEVAMRLHVELHGGRRAVDLTGRVLRTEGRQARAFQFIGDGHRAELERIARSWLTGETSRFHGPPPPALPTPLPALPPALPPLPAAAPFWAQVRRVAWALLGIGVVASAAAYVVTARLTVYSDYAAVAGDLQVVRAASSGVLAGSALKPGAALRAGQVVGRIEPVATPVALAQLTAALETAQAQVSKQKDYLQSLQAGHDGFADFAQRALEEATAVRKLHEDKVRAQQRVYDRMRTLAGMGWASPMRADQEQVNLRTQQHDLMLAREGETAAQQRHDDARRGRFTTDGHSTQLAPADAARDLRVLEAHRDSAASALAALSTSTPIISPCDCTVASVAAPDQSFVTQGNPIADLAVNAARTAEVDALVPSGLLSFVKLGQTVRVFLNDRPNATTAVVAAVNFNPANTGRVGLPDTLRTLGSYGLVTVTLQDAANLNVGLPAVLNAPVQPAMLMRNLPGLATLFGNGTASAAPQER